MSETRQLLLDATQALFEGKFSAQQARNASGPEWIEESWEEIARLGLPFALVDEESGGCDIDPLDALELIRLSGQYIVHLPVAEAMLANLLLSRAGLPPGDGVLTLGYCHQASPLRVVRSGAMWRFTGIATRVPWGRHADTIVASATSANGEMLVRVTPSRCAISHGWNLSGLPRDTITFDMELPGDAVQPIEAGGLTPFLAGANARVLQIAGALSQLLAMTSSYVQERIQFGRPLARFQTIQQEIARLAGQVAAAGSAADAAAEAISGTASALVTSAAKARAAEAAGIASAIAHQLHGAMGFAEEHSLSLFTKALWSWRDEFGSEAFWARRAGDAIFDAGPENLWPLITTA